MCRLKFILLLMFAASGIHAQDIVYYNKNKTDKWKVVDVNPQYLKAVDVADTGMSYSTSLANVLFVFNKKGDFLVIPKLFDDQATADKKVTLFFLNHSKFHEFDKIITLKNEVIICTYEAVEKDKISFKVQDKLSEIELNKVAVVIFSTGQHKLFTTPDKVYKALNAVQDKYTELALSVSGDAGSAVATADDAKEQDAALAGGNASATGTGGSQAQRSADSSKSAAGAVGIDSVLDLSAGSSTETRGTVADTKTTATDAKSGAAEAKPGAVKELEPSTVARLQNKALANIRQLSDYIQVICQKDTDPDELAKTIGQSLALFITDARIEVSSVNRATVNQFKIKDYLVRMSMLKYEKVDIKWYNIQYTSQLRKGPDGFYYGTIEFEQRFVGIGADNSKYEDITRKSVEVVLKSYERNTGGQTTIEWDVFLGDIGVTVTKTA